MNIRADKRLSSGAEIIGPDNMRDANAPVCWSIDPSSGVVQGPLDLCFVAGRTLILTLESDQIAIFSVDGELRGAFFEGIHSLSVCRDDSTCEPGRALIHFMHLTAPFVIPWRQHIPVAPVESDDPTSRMAHGSFTVKIREPIRFFRAFLQGQEGETDQICRDALSQLLPTFLAIHLCQVCGPGATIDKQNKALSELKPQNLNPVLKPYGIECLDVTVKEGFGDILPAESSVSLPPLTATC